jgi:hypothetical protein
MINFNASRAYHATSTVKFGDENEAKRPEWQIQGFPDKDEFDRFNRYASRNALVQESPTLLGTPKVLRVVRDGGTLNYYDSLLLSRPDQPWNQE